jgi:hypothetical protein
VRLSRKTGSIEGMRRGGVLLVRVPVRAETSDFTSTPARPTCYEYYCPPPGLAYSDRRLVKAGLGPVTELVLLRGVWVG